MALRHAQVLPRVGCALRTRGLPWCRRVRPVVALGARRGSGHGGIRAQTARHTRRCVATSRSRIKLPGHTNRARVRFAFAFLVVIEASRAVCAALRRAGRWGGIGIAVYDGEGKQSIAVPAWLLAKRRALPLQPGASSPRFQPIPPPPPPPRSSSSSAYCCVRQLADCAARAQRTQS